MPETMPNPDLLARLRETLAKDGDHMSNAQGDDLIWLAAQLALYPVRVDEAKTTNDRFLRLSAAATLLNQAAGLARRDGGGVSVEQIADEIHGHLSGCFISAVRNRPDNVDECAAAVLALTAAPISAGEEGIIQADRDAAEAYLADPPEIAGEHPLAILLANHRRRFAPPSLGEQE